MQKASPLNKKQRHIFSKNHPKNYVLNYNSPVDAVFLIVFRFKRKPLSDPYNVPIITQVSTCK